MLHFLVILGLMFVAYFYLSSKYETDNIYSGMSTKTAKKLVAERDNVVLVDVRTPSEVAKGTIPGSVHINVTGPGFSEKVKELDPNNVHIVYCASGQRSGLACRKMHRAGLRKLYNLNGGYASWFD